MPRVPAKTRVRAICDGECAEPLVVCGCAPFSQKTVQNCGREFFDRFEKNDSDSDAEPTSPTSRREGDSEASPGKEKKKEKKKAGDEALKLPECLKGEDLYALLEVDSGAGPDDLKKAYRKICLIHHPDKHADKTGADLEAINLNFVKLQECYNILFDVKKRRKYDSTTEFDDKVPKQIKEDQDFYEVCDEVFKRNAKFSERKPVPELGDADTPYEKVKAFYDFWFAFESWRDLDALIMEENGEDCFQDTEDAECREERRWMEKENARVRKNYEKAERQRIFGFVELAEKNDPRMVAERERQWAVKEAAKNAKEAKRVEAERLAQEEQERKAAAEEAARAEKALEKVQRDKEKEAAKKARAKLRKSVQGLKLGFAEDPLQEFLLKLDPQETDKLTETLASGGGEEAVLDVMRTKGVEPIYTKVVDQDQKSTSEGSASEEKLTPEEKAKQQQEQKKRQKEQEKRQKKIDAEQEIVRKQEAAARAVEKAARDVVKKAEQEKKDREIQKQNKKEAEKVKKEQEKKEKEVEQKAEKAKAEKEANKARAEEQRQAHTAENQALQEEKDLELRTFHYERDRLARCDTYDKLDAAGVIEAAQALVANPIVASGLAAAAKSYDADSEDLLDAQLSCLGSFFVLGKRPEEDSLPLSSGLRSRVKKLRAKLRTSALKGDFVFQPAAGTKSDPAALEQMVAAANGEAVHPVDAEAAAAAPVEEAPATAKSKKKAKAKAVPADEEDLDALLKEFDMKPSGEKSKKGGKKK